MEYGEFIELARKRHGDKFEYDEETEKMFNGSHSMISVICPIHGRYYIMARNHLKYDCKKCSYIDRGNKFRCSTDEFVKKAHEVHGDKYDYSKVDYLSAKNDKVCIICQKHGEFWQLPNDHLSGKGCPRCNDSHLERDLSVELERNGVLFERCKHFDWLGKQEIDVFLTDYNIGIECQGKQHFGLGGWSSGFDFEMEYSLDRKKAELCKENGIKLLYYTDKKFKKFLNGLDIYNDSNVFYDKEKIVELCLGK